jgi:hypothetical protein
LRRPTTNPPGASSSGLRRPTTNPPGASSSGLRRPTTNPPGASSSGLRRPGAPPPPPGGSSSSLPRASTRPPAPPAPVPTPAPALGEGIPARPIDEDASTPVKGLDLATAAAAASAAEPAAADSAPALVVHDRLAAGPAPSSRAAINLTAPPGERLDGWSESLVGWIPEESRVGPMPAERRSAPTRSIIAGIAAALLVGGIGVGVALASRSDEPPAAPVAAAPPAPTPAPAVVAAPIAAPPEPESEADLVLDEADLVLEEGDAVALEAPPAAGARSAGTKASKKTTRPALAEAVPDGPVVDLSSATIRRELARNMFHIHRCYDNALENNPSLQGRYKMTITIGLSGKVTGVAIDHDTLGHPGVAACVQRKVLEWRFPVRGRLARPTDVSFPVTFKR